MNKKKLIIYTVLLGMFGHAGSIYAQDGTEIVPNRTPEGAVKFIQTMVEQKLVKASVRQNGKWDPVYFEVPKNEIAKTQEGGDERGIERVEVISNCEMKFYLETPPQVYNYATETLEASKETYSPMPPFKVDFSSVAVVVANGDSYVTLSDIGFKFMVASGDELRKRVAFAAEFLRQSCDKAAGTGF